MDASITISTQSTCLIPWAHDSPIHHTRINYQEKKNSLGSLVKDGVLLILRFQFIDLQFFCIKPTTMYRLRIKGRFLLFVYSFPQKKYMTGYASCMHIPYQSSNTLFNNNIKVYLQFLGSANYKLLVKVFQFT